MRILALCPNGPLVCWTFSLEGLCSVQLGTIEARKRVAFWLRRRQMKHLDFVLLLVRDQGGRRLGFPTTFSLTISYHFCCLYGIRSEVAKFCEGRISARMCNLRPMKAVEKS